MSNSSKKLPPEKITPRKSSRINSSYQPPVDSDGNNPGNGNNSSQLRTTNSTYTVKTKSPLSSLSRRLPPEPERTSYGSENMSNSSSKIISQQPLVSSIGQHLTQQSRNSDYLTTQQQLSSGNTNMPPRISPSDFYLKSRSSEDQVSISSQKSLPPHMASDDTTGSMNSTKSRKMHTLAKNLENKSKQELLIISKEMISEINIKNRIITESKTNEKWILAQVAVAQNGANVIINEIPTTLQSNFSRSSVSAEDKEFLQTLMAFKAELSAAKKKVEEHEVALLNLDKKRTVAEEEAAYLRTIIDPQLKDPSALQTMRVKELEKQLNETIQDYTTLQSKVSQWARSSKRNQEGRISAEAVQKVLEEENEALKAQLAGKGPDGASVIRAFSSVDESKRIKELQEQLANYERQADTEIDTLESKQVELLDTIEALRIKNQELQDVIGSQNEYQSIIKKRTSSLLPDRKLPTPVKNVGTLDINRKYKFLKDKFTLLEQEKNELLESEKILLKQLEVANKNYEKAMEKLEDQEEMQYAMKELETDKKTLQDAYNIALDKVQQKTLAIEMLQRNVDKTRDRMEPLQKSVEALDDLQDLLEQERYAKEELQDHIVSLEEDCKEQQKKILELMEQLGNKDTTTGNIDMAEIEEFQKTIREYKSTIEVLNAQLGAKGKESINIHSQPNQEEELIALKSTVAEKLSIIEQFEELIAEDNQVIQELKAEKSNLTQSLANMEKMKQDFHKQRSEYEMLVEKVKKWESDSNSNITLMGNLQKNSDLDKFESELQSCQSKLNDVLLQKEEIQGHLLELKTKYLALEKENAFLIEQLENTGDVNAEPRLLQLEESLAEFSAQKEHLLSQLQSYHEMEEDYKDEVALRKDLEQKLNQIDSEMDFLQSEFDDKVQKINELQVELAGVRESSRGHELERETTISDLTDKSFDPSPIESNLLSKSQENLSSFITKLDAAEMEIEELRMQLAEKDTNATPGPHKVDTSVSPIKNHDDEKIENDFYQISLYETEIQEKQNEIGKLLGEIDHLEERLLQISEEKNDLERQSNRMVAEINAEHEVEIKRLESINSTSSPGAVKEVKELEKEIAFLKNQLSAKERSVSEKTLDSSLESEMKNLKLQIRDKTNMINNLEDQLKMLSHHNEVDDQCFSSKLDEAEQLLKKKESQIVELQAIIENSGLQNVTNDNEVESYKKQYADSLQQIEKLEETIVELRAKLDHHTGIAENALKQLDQYEYELLELRQRIANENSDSKEDQKLQNILKLRDSEVASLKSQVLALKDAKEEIEDLEMMNGQLLEKITFLSQQIAQQDNNRVSINPNAFAQKSLINSKNELEEVKQQLNEAILKIDAFQNEKADLLDELDDLRDHNMILTSQLNTINK